MSLVLRRCAGIAALAVLYYAAARFGLLLAFADSNASPVWPPSGIAFAALALWGRWLWPGVFAGALAANIVVFSANSAAAALPTLLVSGAIAAGNTLEALAGAWLLQRFGAVPHPWSRLQGVYGFAFIVALVCLLSAAVGTVALSVAGIIGPQVRWTVLGTWWLGDVVGVMVIAPLLMAWRSAAPATLRALVHWETLPFLAILLAILWSIFGTSFTQDGSYRWTAYLMLVAVGWSAWRYRVPGATLTCALIAAAAVAGTTQGMGPFASGTLNDSLFAIQTFIALCTLVGLVLCADMEELHERNADSLLRFRPVRQWATLMACLAVTVFVWHIVSSATEVRARERFNDAAGNIGQRVVERMRTYEQALLSGTALFAASETVSRGEWKKFVERMGVANNFPGVQGIGFAQSVAPGEREQVERDVAAQGFPDFRIWPARPGRAAMAVLYLEPFSARNRRAFGYDLLSEGARSKAVERAVLSGLPALTSRVTLRQEEAAGPQAGFLMFVPVYRNGMPVASSAQRSAALLGVVYSPFRINDLMNGILSSSESDMVLEIFDGAAIGPDSLMYASVERDTSERVNYPNPFRAAMPVALQQHGWMIQVTSRAAFENSIDRQKAQIVLVAGTLISLLFFGVVRSMAEREESAAGKAEQMRTALAHSERKFESLVDAAFEFSIIATDLEGVIQVFSAGAERMLGYHAAEMVGHATLSMLHLPDEVERHALEILAQEGIRAEGPEVFVAVARKRGSQQREWTYVRQDGTRIPVSVVVTAIVDAGARTVGFLAIAHNVSKQHELQDSLVRAKELAEAASSAKSEFVANMSHEIRTPMNAVLGLTHLLRKSDITPEQRTYLDMISSAGKSLLGIINDVLDFSKIEAGRMDLSPEAFELDTILDHCASIMAVDASDKNLELVITAAPGLPHALHGDVLRLQQILANLLSNAIKFTDAGEVSLLVEEQARREDVVDVCFTVRDTGIGIAQANLEKLFAPFTQADASMTRRFGGTGLGLTISKSLVELMGGTIRIDSRIGHGSAFSVTLPFQMRPPAQAAAQGRDAYRLLVLDDNASSLASLRACSQRLGWQVTVGDPDGLPLRGAAGSIDAVIVNAGASPAELTRVSAAIASVIADMQLPLIVLAMGHAREQLSLAAPGKLAILAKPFTPNSLQATLAGAIRPVQPGPRAAGPTQRCAGLRILVVEDNELNQVVAKGILEGEGAQVTIAGDGAQALAMLETPGRYDIILMDVQMPVMDGLSATRELRGRLKLALPVIAMSAGVLASERAQCTAAGMNDFIAKPLDHELMLDKILEWTRRAAPGTAAMESGTAGAEGVFDVSALERLNARQPARQGELVSLIERALLAAPVQLESARAAFLAGDRLAAARELHTLRGAIGTVGAKRFVQVCLELGAALKQGNTNEARLLFDQASAELQDTCAQGQVWLCQMASNQSS